MKQRRPHALILGTVWPEPTSSAAGVRVRSDIETLLAHGWHVTFGSSAKDSPFREALNQLGAQTVSIVENDSAMQDVFHQLRPDLTIFDRFMTEEKFGWQIREACPDCARVLDTIDLHSLRHARQQVVLAGADLASVKPVIPSLNDETLLRELASIYRCDLSLLLSDAELDILIGSFAVPSEKVALHPITYADPPSGFPGFSDRRHMVSIGNFRHPPNRDAFFFLKEQVWPAIRRDLPDCELHLYGAYPPKDIMESSDPDAGFLVKGPCRDQIKTLAAYRVTLAPVRYGAGIKGKISDSWFAGQPVVTTSIGAEGMGPENAWGGAVTDDIESLRTAAVRLYTHESDWSESVQRGRAILAAQFSRARREPLLLSTLSQLLDHLSARRASDSIGSLLWHQNQRCTEYFSRWIEAKNRPAS